MVTAIEPSSPRGYGYWTCRLKVRRTDNDTLATVPYPANCLVDPTASPAPADLTPPPLAAG